METVERRSSRPLSIAWSANPSRCVTQSTPDLPPPLYEEPTARDGPSIALDPLPGCGTRRSTRRTVHNAPLVTLRWASDDVTATAVAD